MIATPLESDLVDRIRSELTDLAVHYEPDLLPTPRYPGDHRGRAGFQRTPEGESHWQELLSGAAITFGIPGDEPQELRRLVRHAPSLRLVQATAAGAGQQVETAGLSADDLERVAVASSSGVHAGPLAEFALFGVLAFARGAPRLQRDRDARRWDHYPTRDVAGRTIVILGVGAIGSRIATLSKALGMYVVGVNHRGRGQAESVDEYATAEQLPALAGRADILVITLPSTRATIGMVDAAVLSCLPQDAIVVNVGRGNVIDEPALIQLLAAGHLAGAALDVTNDEPPDATSPLWTLPNVIMSPHTAALSPHENQRIVTLFIDNVSRILHGRPVLNRITGARPY
ncbi:MAG: D-2-hydroxyacid dehydrogenase [Actinomycetota bacterium]|nr:D-2-hydroxyacid dehydrogenase [Actinomycetota bacterium]